MKTYFDRLPEEIIQHIWKFVFYNTIKEIREKHRYGSIPKDFCNSQFCCLITKSLSKKEGFWYDKLKKDYNVVLFAKERWRIPWIFQYGYYNYEDNYINQKRNKIFASTYGCCAYKNYTKKIFCNDLRNSKEYSKDYLKKQLLLNQRIVYKSWTRNRMIKELMSL